MRTIIAAITTPTSLLVGSILLFTVFLIWYHAALKKRDKNYMLWRLLCFLPLAACLIHFAVYNFGKQAIYSLYYFGTMYLFVVLIAIWQFVYNKKILYRVFACVLLVCGVFSYIYIPGGVPLPSNLHCYTGRDWTSSFVKTVRTMEAEYPLSEWKQIDYDELLDEFVPRIEEAQRQGDVTALGIALNDYCNRFYDGHLYLQPANAQIANNINESLLGNDYGLSLITLESGNVAAILVEPEGEAELAGIQNGTIVTKWDGVAIGEAKNALQIPINPPVAENEEPARTMFLAGRGDDAVEVTFLTADGEEKTVTLHRIGNYYERYKKAYAAFCGLTEDRGNFSYKMVSDTCGYLSITSEDVDLPRRLQAVFTGQVPSYTSKTDQILEELKAQGMTELIIDIRNNTGGFPQVSSAVASLFYEKDYVHSYELGSVNAKASPDPMIVKGNGKWNDLQTVVLVNQNTVSAGDCLADLLGDCPNVTLMGMTPSNCSYQTTGGLCYLAQGYFSIYYPVGLSIDGQGNPVIDTSSARQATIPLEHRIPIDETAVQEMFCNENGDYELSYAINWLKQCKSE